MGYPDSLELLALPRGHKVGGGRYTLQEPLGRGILGITYKAWDEKLARSVIVKEFFPHGTIREGVKISFPDSSAYEQMKKKFIDEMRIISTIKHKSIIEVYDLIEESSGVYSVLESMKGKRLGDVVIKKPLSGEAALYYFWDLLRALEVLHKRGVLHRHILPYHIYLEEWRAVLTEFGAARYFVAQKTRNLTRYVSAGFSPLEEYIELSDSATSITYAADFYALGACFYYGLTQQVPSDAPTRLMSKDRDTLKHLRELRRDIPLALADAIMWCLEVMPEARPQKAEDLMNRLPPPPPKPSWV